MPRETRQASAAHAAAERSARTPQQQLALLDARCGKNQGSQKERTRLLALIGTKEEVAEEPKPKKKKKKQAEA